MSDTVKNLTDLFALIVKNPTLAKHLKADPQRVAEIFGVSLSKEEAAQISQKLDMNAITKFAQEVDSMAAKVAQGVGIRSGGTSKK